MDYGNHKAYLDHLLLVGKNNLANKAGVSTPIVWDPAPGLSTWKADKDTQREAAILAFNQKKEQEQQRLTDMFNNSTGGVGVTSYTYPEQLPTNKPVQKTSIKSNSQISPERQAVMEQQKLLNQQLGTNLKVDGIMGPKTQKAMDMMQGRREADLARAVQAEAATMNQTPTQTETPNTLKQQNGWQLDKEATDKMHQQWLNNELGEGQVPTAVYKAPEEGLANWLGGLFK